MKESANSFVYCSELGDLTQQKTQETAGRKPIRIPNAMKKPLFAIAAIAFAAATVATQGDEKKKTPGEIFSKVPVHRLDGKTFKKAELKKSPEYYVLYYSASW